MKDIAMYIESRQLHMFEGSSQDDIVELENKEKALSTSLTSEKIQDGGNMYDSTLMEKILTETT